MNPNHPRHNGPWGDHSQNHEPRFRHIRPPFPGQFFEPPPIGGHFHPRMHNPPGYHDPMAHIRPPMGLAPLPPLGQIFPPPDVAKDQALGDQGTKELKKESKMTPIENLTPTVAIPLPSDLPQMESSTVSGPPESAPTSSEPSPIKAKSNIIGKATARKLLKSFNFTKTVQRDKKPAKAITEDDTAVVTITSKVKKKSVIEQIRDDERRLKEALGLTKLSQTNFDGLSHLNTLMDNPDAMKKFEEKGRYLREKLKQKEAWFPSEERSSGNRKSDSNKDRYKDKSSGRSDSIKRKDGSSSDHRRTLDKKRSEVSSSSSKAKMPDKPSREHKYADSKFISEKEKSVKSDNDVKSDVYLLGESGSVKETQQQRKDLVQETQEEKSMSVGTSQKHLSKRDNSRVKIPDSWKAFKDSGLSFRDLRDMNAKNNEASEPSQERDIWVGLKTPKLFYPVTAIQAKDEKLKKEYRAALVRETTVKPVITYSINPDLHEFYFVTRREAMLKNKDHDVLNNMEKIFNGSDQVLSSENPSTDRNCYLDFRTDRPFVEIREETWSPSVTVASKSLVDENYASPSEEPDSPARISGPDLEEYSVIDEVECEKKDELVANSSQSEGSPIIAKDDYQCSKSSSPSLKGDDMEEKMVIGSTEKEDCVVTDAPEKSLKIKEIRALLAKTNDKKEKKRLKRLKKSVKKARKEKKRLKKEKKRLKKEKKKEKKLQKKKAKEAQKTSTEATDNEIYCPFEDFGEDFSDSADKDIPIKNHEEQNLDEGSSQSLIYSPSNPVASGSNSPVPMDIDDDEEEEPIPANISAVDLSSIPTPPVTQAPPVLNIPQPVPPVSLTHGTVLKPTLSNITSTNLPEQISSSIETKPVAFKLSLNKTSSSKLFKGSLPGFVEDEEPASPSLKIPFLSNKDLKFPGAGSPDSLSKSSAEQMLDEKQVNVTLPDSAVKEVKKSEEMNIPVINSDPVDQVKIDKQKSVSPPIKETSSVSKPVTDEKPMAEVLSKAKRPESSKVESSRRSSDKARSPSGSHRSSSPRRRSRGSSPYRRSRRYSPSRYRRSDDKRSYRSRSRSPKRRRRSRSPRRSYRTTSPRRSHRSRSRTPNYTQKDRSRTPTRVLERNTNLREISLQPPASAPDLGTGSTSQSPAEYAHNQSSVGTSSPFVDSGVIQTIGTTESMLNPASNSPKRPSLVDRLREEHGLQVEDSSQYNPYGERLESTSSAYDWHGQRSYNQDMDWQSTSTQPQPQQVIRVGNFLQVLPQQSVVPDQTQAPKDSSQEILSTKGLAPSLSPMQDGKVSPLPSPSPTKTQEELKNIPPPVPEPLPCGNEPAMIAPPQGVPAVPGLSSEALLSAAAATAAASNIPFAHLISVLQQQNLLPSNTPQPTPPQEVYVQQTPVEVPVPPVDQIPLPEVDVEALRRASKERKARKRKMKEEKRRLRQEQREALINKDAHESDEEAAEPETEPSTSAETPETSAESNTLNNTKEVLSEKSRSRKPWHPSLDLPPPEKGILVIPTYTDKNCAKQKGVVFADGILPGDGTSDGEIIEIPMVDESPVKKKKLKKHKKAKVKPIKQYEVDNDGICSPPPPPNCPPPPGSCQLYPGWNHYTLTAPDTCVVYAQPPPPLPMVDINNSFPLQCFS